jgi:poly-gamma-glutamate synthesis protein (capsule biosynthesis protein)
LEPLLTIPVSAAVQDSITLLAAGDLYLPPDFPAPPDGAAASMLMDPDLSELVSTADLSMINLECPLARGDRPSRKSGPSLHGHPALARALASAGFRVAVLANNHITDQGDGPMMATKALLQAEGVEPVGIGADLEDACKPVWLESGGLKIAVLAFAEHEFCCAGPGRAGAAQLEPAIVGRAILATRPTADLVIVNVHGGNQFYFAPSPQMQTWCRFFVDCGADAVIGHHPHCVQGTEIYRGRPIVYSLGNFLFNYSGEWTWSPSWYVGWVVRLRLGAGGVRSMELFPIQQGSEATGGRAVLMDRRPCDDYRVRLNRLNDVASDPELIREFWRCLCHDRRPEFAGLLLSGACAGPAGLWRMFKGSVREASIFRFGAWMAGMLGRYATTARTSQREVTALCNLLRCASHLEVVRTVLEMEAEGITPSAVIWSEYQELMSS